MTGKKIKEIRVAMLMTQREFADALGVHPITLSDWEIGDRVPSLRNQRKIVELCKKNNIDWRE